PTFEEGESRSSSAALLRCARTGLRGGRRGPAPRRGRDPRVSRPMARRRCDGRGGRGRPLPQPALAGRGHLMPGLAYIGPGAGFTLMTSSFVLVTTVLIVLVSLLIWPFRTVWRRLRYGRRPEPWIRRLVIVGFDGQDPKLTDQYLAEGKLPNFARLAARGSYH